MEVMKGSSNSAETRDSNHFVEQSGKRNYQRKNLDKMIMRNGSLERHFRAHTKQPKMYKCNVCPVSYSTSLNLSIHLAEEHKISPGGTKPNTTYNCDVCKISFDKNYKLTRHMLVHENERRFKCGVCKIMLKTNDSLKMHLKRHEGNAAKKFDCGLCEKKFLTKVEMEIHLRYHTGEKPVKCECGKSFAEKWTLQGHQKTHEVLREKFTCSICDGSYASKKYLRFHINSVHGSARPYQCDMCQKTFKTVNVLKNHSNKVHYGVSYKFWCLFCQREFHSRGDLFRHLIRHIREKPFYCPGCDVSVSSGAALWRHMKSKKHLSTMTQ